MATHSANSLFSTNITSAKDCLALYDGVVNLKPAGLDIDWILRASIVFAVSALDTYFHDKVKYRVGKFSLENLPPALAKFQIQIAELTSWEQSERKGNTLRNWVVQYLSVRPLQSPNAIGDALKLANILSFWDTIEPNESKRTQMLKDFNGLIKRRNQISHEGDREQSRGRGKALRPIDRGRGYAGGKSVRCRSNSRVCRRT